MRWLKENIRAQFITKAEEGGKLLDFIPKMAEFVKFVKCEEKMP